MDYSLISIFAVLHLVGTIAGVAYSTFAEAYYIRASSDGVIDKHERKYLRHLFRALKVATPVVVCSSVALIVLEYLAIGAPQAVVGAPFWAAQTLILIIVLFGYALEKRQTPWWVASAGIVVGWWMLLCIDLGYFSSNGYIAIMMLYAVVTFLIAGVIGYLRLWFWHPKMKRVADENPQKS